MESSYEDLFISNQSSNGTECRICIASVTGHSWKEFINNFETVESLKQKIWHRSGVLPHHQGLIFAGKCLTNNGSHELELLRDLGVRENSVIRLLVMTRSGPLSLATTPSHSANSTSIPCSSRTKFFNMDSSFFDVCDIQSQMKRDSSFAEGQSGIYTPEDTSAKESSAGETEHDDDSNCFPTLIDTFPKCPENSQMAARTNHKRIRRSSIKEEAMMIRNKDNAARNQLLLLMNTRTISPSTDLNTFSEDGSELSSGVIICDLTNDFRKLRVRKKHHAVGSSTGIVQKSRTKSRPRAPTASLHNQKGSDITSSDEEKPCLKRADFTFGFATSRRNSGINRSQKYMSGYQSQYRCHACSAKLNANFGNFQCRCGKTLCMRHRPAEMHMCTRTRKLQDVSD